MPEGSSFDLIVIGGGPGGYVGAIRAAQLGLNVACVERDKLGGVCLNYGCIPTKALLAGAEFYHRVTHEAAEWGVSVENVSYNWQKVIERSRGVAAQLNRGVHGLFRKNKVTHIEGHAFINAPGTVHIFDKDDIEHKGTPTQTLTAKYIMIATGAFPRELPGAPFDGEYIISSKKAMTIQEQPKSLLIVGSGAIGMEFGYFYNAFGTDVTIVEMVDRLMPIEDGEISKEIERAFKKQGIKTLTGHKTLSLEKTGNGIKAVVAPTSDESKTQTIEADKAIVAIGVKGRFDGLFDDSLGLEIYKEHIKVDKKNYMTNIPGIYAVGDVIGPPWLAHVASEEAVVCVELLAGHHATPIDYESVPGCTYCHPQVASIGLTEEACKAKGLDYTAGKFPFSASGKAQALGQTQGFTKIITDKKHGELLGAHMIGENVTELIAEMGLARRLEATGAEISATMHAHPTLSEAVMEAALGAEGRMIHF